MENGFVKERQGEGGSRSISWGVFVQELKYVGFLALPMISVTLSQYFLQIISMMMVGHLDKRSCKSSFAILGLSLN